MIPKLLSSCGALLLLAGSASAELLWNKPIQDFQCVPEQNQVEAHFAFKNAGTTPITIKDVKPSCSCTTARLDKKTYAPGETGEIVATYKFWGHAGQLRKLIQVYTDDQPRQPAVLDIRVFVYEPFQIQPGLVYWRKGEAAEAKPVQLTANGYPVKIKKVSSSNPNIAATLQTVKDGEAYTVLVKPSDTAQKDAAEITVQTDFPPDAPHAYTIHARIK
jgi:hypothetical protein